MNLFKELVWDSIVEAVLGRLFTMVPLLGWGPIGYVISYFAVKYSDLLFEGITLFVDVTLIRIRNKEFQKAYDRASIRLMSLADDFGVDHEEFRKARDEDKRALRYLAQFNIARA